MTVPARHNRWFAAWRVACVCWCMLFGLGTTAVLAQGVQPVPELSGHVVDQTGTLDSAALARIGAQLAALEQRKGSQMVVLLVRSTQPEDIATYANRVANAWKIGRRGTGDGLLLVVALDDRRVRIEVSKALEGAVPDLAARRVIDEFITPAFRRQDFAGGIEAGVVRLSALIDHESLPAPEPPTGQPSQPGIQWLDLVIFAFFAVPVIGAVLSTLLGKRLGSIGTGVAGGGLVGWFTASWVLGVLAGLAVMVFTLANASRFATGRGARGMGRGGWRHGSGSWGSGGSASSGGFGTWSSGGFGSGGGGDFGGGGASGDW